MSKLFGRYKADKEQEAQPPAKSPTACFVDGCPLPGSYRMTNETSICCVHDGEDGHRWAGQTERVSRRLKLWDAAFRMLNAPSGTPVPDATLRAIESHMELPRTTGQPTMRGFGGYLRRLLIMECKGPRPAFPEEVKRALDPIAALTERMTV